MSKIENEDNKVVSNSSSSSSSSSNSQPLKRKILRWPIMVDDGQVESVQNRFKALDLAMAIPNKKKFENYENLDEKGKAVKAKKEQREKELEKNLDDDDNFIQNPFTR
jgi:hypothetical protein